MQKQETETEKNDFDTKICMNTTYNLAFRIKIYIFGGLKLNDVSLT